MLQAWAAVFLAISLLSSCSKKNERESYNETIRAAEARADEGRFDEAIAVLQEILPNAPDPDRVRVVLASVYLRRAGIRLADFLDLAVTVQRQELDGNLKLRNSFELGKTATVRSLYRFNGLLVDFHMVWEKLDSLPRLQDDQIEDAERAMAVLRDISSPPPGTALFRGLVNATVAKFKWSHMSFEGRSVCKFTLSELSLLIDYFEQTVLSVFDDLKIGLTKSQISLANQTQLVRDTMSDLKEWLARSQESFASGKSTVREVWSKVEDSECPF